jgi:hypothetical protein
MYFFAMMRLCALVVTRMLLLTMLMLMMATRLLVLSVMVDPFDVLVD